MKKAAGRVACRLLLLASTTVGCAFQDWTDDQGGAREDDGYRDPGTDRGRRDDGAVDGWGDTWDAWVDDGLQDTSVEVGEDIRPEASQDVAPDASQDLPFEASQDLAVDLGPSDADLDVPTDSTGPCTPPPGPGYVNFEVFGFPIDGSPMPPWGRGVIQGDGTLKAIEQTRSGWRYVFELSDGQTPTVETNLPQKESIPFAVGESVHFYAKQDLPWWRDVVLVLWDTYKTPRFVYQDAARTGTPEAWFDCGATTWLCPTIRMLPDTCPPVDGECGKRQFPPVEMLAFGGLASSEVPTALRQGFDGPSTTNTAIHYRVYEAYRIDPSSQVCADYPTEWIRASIRLDPPALESP